MPIGRTEALDNELGSLARELVQRARQMLYVWPLRVCIDKALIPDTLVRAAFQSCLLAHNGCSALLASEALQWNPMVRQAATCLPREGGARAPLARTRTGRLTAEAGGPKQ
jgi:hypothetical protein